MHRTRARLSDGREIVYYDAEPGRRPVPDRRGLPPVEPLCEVRRDPLTGDHVTITAHRNARTFLPPADQCPLCPGGPASEIPDPSYEVAVFENRFPSFDVRTPPVPPVVDGVERTRGNGRCEVVCFTDEHDASMSALPVSRVRAVVDAWADRTAELSAIPGVRQVFVFENRGVEIGVTLHHPHGQIYGYPYVTPQTRAHLEAAARHRESTGRNLFGDILAAERAGPRVVAANDHWTAFVPYAARWPFEVHLYPNERFADLTELPEGHIAAFAPIYLEVLRRFDGAFPDSGPMPYMSGWHQAPVGEHRDLAWLRLEIVSTRRAAGKVKFLASSESVMGGFVNDLGPEKAAQILKEAL